MNDYRKANSFILYDANMLFGEFESVLDTHATWVVNGYELAKLAQAFGVVTYPVDVGKQRTSLENMEFPIRRQVHYFGAAWSDAKVLAVFARIDGPQMLSIRARIEWGNDEEPETLEYAYAGRFMIEWAEPDTQQGVE